MISSPRMATRRDVFGCFGTTHHAGATKPPADAADAAGSAAAGGRAAAGAGNGAGAGRRWPNMLAGSHEPAASRLFSRSGEPVRQPRRALSRPPGAITIRGKISERNQKSY